MICVRRRKDRKLEVLIRKTRIVQMHRKSSRKSWRKREEELTSEWNNRVILYLIKSSIWGKNEGGRTYSQSINTRGISYITGSCSPLVNGAK